MLVPRARRTRARTCIRFFSGEKGDRVLQPFVSAECAGVRGLVSASLLLKGAFEHHTVAIDTISTSPANMEGSLTAASDEWSGSPSE